MVVGIERFKEAMADYADNYVIIGGTACDIVLSGTPMPPRPTKDIDMIVVVENLTHDFVDAFWAFIHAGGYKLYKRVNVRGELVYALYRFDHPTEAGFPFQIELLSRHSELLGEPSGYHIEPIPDDAEHQSLSAIIMNEELYQFTLDHSIIRDGIRLADTLALIALKTTAYLNLVAEKAAGHHVNGDDIKKHRSDVLKLVASGDITDPVVLPTAIYEKIDNFRRAMHEDSEESIVKILGGNRDTYLLVMEDLDELFQQE